MFKFICLSVYYSIYMYPWLAESDWKINSRLTDRLDSIDSLLKVLSGHRSESCSASNSCLQASAPF